MTSKGYYCQGALWMRACGLVRWMLGWEGRVLGARELSGWLLSVERQNLQYVSGHKRSPIKHRVV